MKIVVLDGYTLNPGDLSWDGFKALGDLKVHDRTHVDHIVDRAGHAEAVLTNKTPLNRETIRKLTALKYIGVLATGINVVNVEAAHKRGVVVTNVPGYATRTVAEAVFAMIFEHTRRVSLHAYSVRQGKWSRQQDFSYALRPLQEIAGLTMGLIGYGAVGRAVADIAKAFGMQVIVNTRTPPKDPVSGLRFVDLDTVFRESDIVSLHCPLTPETDHLVNSQRLAQMKPRSLLVNTARGGLVDEAALLEALRTGKISAALDVLAEEPPSIKNPLLRARNCIITPHQAWATRAARARLMQAAVDNLRAFVEGKPVNVV